MQWTLEHHLTRQPPQTPTACTKRNEGSVLSSQGTGVRGRANDKTSPAFANQGNRNGERGVLRKRGHLKALLPNMVNLKSTAKTNTNKELMKVTGPRLRKT